MDSYDFPSFDYHSFDPQATTVDGDSHRAYGANATTTLHTLLTSSNYSTSFPCPPLLHTNSTTSNTSSTLSSPPEVTAVEVDIASPDDYRLSDYLLASDVFDFKTFDDDNCRQLETEIDTLIEPYFAASDVASDFLTFREGPDTDLAALLALKNSLQDSFPDIFLGQDMAPVYSGQSSMSASIPAPTPAQTPSNTLDRAKISAVSCASEESSEENKVSSVTGWSPDEGQEYPYVDVAVDVLDFTLSGHFNALSGPNSGVEFGHKINPSKHAKIRRSDPKPDRSQSRKKTGTDKKQGLEQRRHSDSDGLVSTRQIHEPIHAQEAVNPNGMWAFDTSMPAPSFAPLSVAPASTPFSPFCPPFHISMQTKQAPGIHKLVSKPAVKLARPMLPARSRSRPNLHTFLPPSAARAITQHARQIQEAERKSLQVDQGRSGSEAAPDVSYAQSAYQNVWRLNENQKRRDNSGKQSEGQGMAMFAWKSTSNIDDTQAKEMSPTYGTACHSSQPDHWPHGNGRHEANATLPYLSSDSTAYFPPASPLSLVNSSTPSLHIASQSSTGALRQYDDPFKVQPVPSYGRFDAAVHPPMGSSTSSHPYVSISSTPLSHSNSANAVMLEPNLSFSFGCQGNNSLPSPQLGQGSSRVLQARTTNIETLPRPRSHPPPLPCYRSQLIGDPFRSVKRAADENSEAAQETTRSKRGRVSR